MAGIGIGIGIGLRKILSRIIPYFFSDLDTWHKTISGTNFAESINNLPAKFLPRISSLNGTDDRLNFTQITSKELELFIKLKGYTRQANDAFWGHNSINFINCTTDTNLRVRINANILDFTVQDVSLLDIIEIKIIIRTSASVTYVRVFINDLESTSGELNTGTDDSCIVSNIGFLIAYLQAKIIETYVKDTSTGLDIFHYYPKGMGDYEYDISGNNNHGTWSGTGSRFDYDINSSTYPNGNGYSLWQKASNPDIQPPFDINGNPLSLTAGVNIPAGYTHKRDLQAGNTKHNIYDSLIDMEYGSILQNDTSGVSYATQTDAYGLVFDGIINKGGDTNNTFVNMISADNTTSGNGYQIIIGSSETIQLNRTGVSVKFKTANSYILINTDYRYLVWRNETVDQFVTGAAGTFVAYIQGKNKPITTTEYEIPNTNEMELINVIGGSGTNPVTDNTYTTSSNIVNDLDVGDQISKININGNYISPYDFTVSTGAYSIIDNPDNAIYRRSNSVIHTTFSQASTFYNSNKPFIYHVTELADPRIYNKSGAEFIQAASRDRIFGKVKRDGTDIIRLDELEGYATQKTGGALTNVTNYNKITDIYHI